MATNVQQHARMTGVLPNRLGGEESEDSEDEMPRLARPEGAALTMMGLSMEARVNHLILTAPARAMMVAI